MHRVYLGIGGNLGDREENLNSTLRLIAEKVGTVEAVSPIYESEPWGFSHAQSFLNQVVEVVTSLKPLQLLQVCKGIEVALGREQLQHSGYAGRTADVDILFYDDIILNDPLLTIPHAKLHERFFVLKPLVQIAPGLTHPLLQKSIVQLLDECTDVGGVWEYGKLE